MLVKNILLFFSVALLINCIASSQVILAQDHTAFTVTKFFDDGFNNAVEIRLSCNSGIPPSQSTWVDPGYSTTFYVTELEIIDPDIRCEITEESNLDNYTALYIANGVDSDSSCLYAGGIEGNLLDYNSCAIENSSSPEFRILGRTKWQSGNLHEYIVINFPEKAWEDASDDLSALSAGFHLATITSQEEQDFLSNFLAENMLYGQWWLGGIQVPLDEPDPSKGWTWVTGEAWDYTNWQEDEPNDGGGCLCENHLATGVRTWNDEGSAIRSISGYLAESLDPIFYDSFED